ncbi:MAG TPA: response regulator [Candidatus Acidoferrales bacterium]
MPRILVADDNTNIQKMVVLAFEERGVDVVAVGNGEAAVRRIPDANPDLVLADVFMPVRNGYEVCEFVKKDTRFAHVPVILLVGAFDPLDEKEARRVGADGVLKKPFVPPDPLIAMVMSALEKNPKVAAELAKARETPPEPPPPPVMEIAAKAEPKPLPDFPEPSPEEAAAIYGFGKGVRSLDDEPETEERKTPKTPVAKAKDSDENEDDFDGAATATDWRRTGGMDFEIPENTAVDPAYSYGKDLAPITFPSEKEVPPKRIHVRDDELDGESAAPLAPLGQQLASKLAESSPTPEEQETQSFAPYGMRLSGDPEPTADDAPAPWHESPAFQSAVNNPAATQEEPPVQAAAPKKEEVPAVIEMKQPAPAPVATKTSHASTPWTDLTAPPSEYPEGSWMTESSSAPAPHISASEPKHVSEPAASAPAWRMEPAIAPPASSDSSWRSPLESRPAHEQRTEEASANEEVRPRKKSWFADAIEAVREVVHGGAPSAAEPEQPISTAHADADVSEAASERMPEPVVSTALVAPVREEVHEQVHQEPLAAETAEVPSHFVERASFETKSDAEIITTPDHGTPSHKDPALEMPPAARVTPEPLLVRDEPAFSSYKDHHKHAAPLQSFSFPGESESTNGEPAAGIPATSHEEEDPIFVAAPEASAVDEPAHTDFSERIPTVPPPNREALAGIPFLMPSAAALEQVNSPQAPSPQANLDEVVQKVLERLEPQLHELLSKNLLKPLVENMLQAELAKKENR